MTHNESDVALFHASTVRKPVVAYASVRALADAKAPVKLHLDVRCAGLERSICHPREDTTLAVGEFSSLEELAEFDASRPCRVCALEVVLDSVLRPGVSGAQRLVSFTSQPNPNERLQGYKWRSATESGNARLGRVAARLGLEVCTAACGLVAWGHLPERGSRVLARSLRCYELPLDADPSAAEIAMLWALLDDNPPELDAPSGPDLWELAQLVCATGR